MDEEIDRQGTAHAVIGIGGFGTFVALCILALKDTLLGVNHSLSVLDSNKEDIDRAKEAGIAHQYLNPAGDEADFGDDRHDSIIRWPEMFDPRTKFFVRFAEKYGADAMDAFGVGAGAGTRPPFGQFVFRSKRSTVCEFLRDRLGAALATAETVQPIFVGSGGGGTSCPGILECARLTGTPDGLAECIDQSPSRVRKPWVFTLPPFIQSRMAPTDVFKLRPLANYFAFMLECDALARRKVIEYSIRLNTQNGVGAAVDTVPAAATLMADVIADTMIGSDAALATFCDGWMIVRHNPDLRGLQTKPRPSRFARKHGPR